MTTKSTPHLLDLDNALLHLRPGDLEQIHKSLAHDLPDSSFQNAIVSFLDLFGLVAG